MNKWLTLFFIAASAYPLRAQEPDVEHGKAYVQGFGCIRCHTINGEGGKYGPDLTFIGFRKTGPWLDRWLKNPHGWKANTPMPNFNLSDGVRKSLVDYLTTLQGQEYLKDKPWNAAAYASDPVKKGAAIFETAGCVGCHGRGGVGGYPNNNVVGGKIPSLVNVSDGYSKEELESKIRVGVPHPQKSDPNGEEPMIYMPAWGKLLQDDEIDAVAAYLLSLKPKKAGGEEW